MGEFLAKSQPHEWTESQRTLYNMQSMMKIDGLLLVINNLAFVCMVSLIFRFLLMYFPYFSYLTKMVRAVLKPVMVVLVLLVINLAMFGIVFYVTMSDELFNFRDGLATAMSTVQFAHGGFLQWPEWYSDYGWTFILATWAGFFVF